MTRNRTILLSIILIILSLSITTITTYNYTSSDYQKIVVDGRIRSFIVRLPDNYTESKAYPLVLGFHGGGGNAKGFEARSGLTKIANREEFIVCYPNGNGRLDYYFLTWNGGYCCEYALEENIDDVEFIRQLLNNLNESYSINSSRIYATGMSNGAILTHRLGAEMSEIFAAIAPVAGSIGGYESRNSELYLPPQPIARLPVLLVHGTADTHVAFEGGHAILAAGSRIDLSFNDSISFWTRANNAVLVDNYTAGSLVITRYAGENTRSDVLACVILSGIHVWPGEPTDPLKALEASELIWYFFSNHTK